MLFRPSLLKLEKGKAHRRLHRRTDRLSWIIAKDPGQSHDTKELTRGQRPLFSKGKTVDNSVASSGMRRRRGAGIGRSASRCVGDARAHHRGATSYPQVFPRGPLIAQAVSEAACRLACRDRTRVAGRAAHTPAQAVVPRFVRRRERKEDAWTFSLRWRDVLSWSLRIRVVARGGLG